MNMNIIITYLNCYVHEYNKDVNASLGESSTST